jgi:hypothetical protein
VKRHYLALEEKRGVKKREEGEGWREEEEREGRRREGRRREGKTWLWRKPHTRQPQHQLSFRKKHSDSVNFLLSILSQISLLGKRRDPGTTGQETTEYAALGSRNHGR